MTTTTPAPTPVRRSWSSGRTLLVVFGTLFATVSLILLAIGGFGLWAQQQRNDDGYFSTGTAQLTTGQFALTAPSLDINGSGPDAFYTEDFLGDVRVQLESRKSDVPVFIGIGPSDAVSTYLAGVGHDEVSDLEVDPFRPTYTTRSGGRPATAPADQSFWVAADTGTGPRTLTWAAAEGDWTVVIMNADGSPNVDVDLSAGGTLPVVEGITAGSLVGSVLMLMIAAAMIVPALVRKQQPAGR